MRRVVARRYKDAASAYRARPRAREPQHHAARIRSQSRRCTSGLSQELSERLCIWRQLKSKIACLEGDWCIDAAPARSEGAAWQERDLGHLGDVAEVQANVTRVTWLECLLCRVEPESASWVLTKLDRIDDRAVAVS